MMEKILPIENIINNSAEISDNEGAGSFVPENKQINNAGLPENIEQNEFNREMREKLHKLLLEQEIIKEVDGVLYFDENKFNQDKEFLTRLKNTTLVNPEINKRFYGSKKLISELLGDLEIRSKDAEKTGKEKAGLEKLSDYIDQTSEKLSEKEKMIDLLVKDNIMTRVDDINVIDLEKFLNWEPLRYKYRNSHKKYDKTGKRFLITGVMVYECLKDLDVIDKKEFENCPDKKSLKTKPLFNVPENIDEAFDIEQIKSKQYYLNPWEIYSGEGGKVRWNNNVKARNNEEISMREMGYALAIFRDFGGHRDKDGNLMVRSGKDSKDYEKISYNWFEKNGISFGTIGGDRLGLTSPRMLLINYCPHIIERRLVLPSDFSMMSNSKTGEIFRPEKKSKLYTMINRMRYYIGRESFLYDDKKYSMEKISIAKLDNSKAGIIFKDKGRETLLCTLDLLNEAEIEAVRKKIIEKKGEKATKNEITNFSTLNADDVSKRLNKWEPTKDSPPRAGESHEKYAERIRRIADWSFIRETTSDFSEKAGVGIHNLSWREQQWLCGAAVEMDGKENKRLIEFGKQYGLNGLKTFLSCEFDIQNRNKILSIGENLNDQPEVAEKLFSEYARIVGDAEKTIEELTEKFSGLFSKEEKKKN